VRNLVPTETVATVTLPFVRGAVATMSFKPWLDGEDGADTLFVSTHGHGPRDPGTLCLCVSSPSSLRPTPPTPPLCRVQSVDGAAVLSRVRCQRRVE